MYAKIIDAENRLDGLLPPRRLEQCPAAELMAAAVEWSEEVWAVARQLGPVPLADEQVTRGNDLAWGGVFVCGVHRSGTTLVRDLLDDHPSLVVLPSEGTYYTNLEPKLKAMPHEKRAGFITKEWLRRLVNPINQPPYWLLGRSSEAEGSPYVDFARYVLAWRKEVNRQSPQWPHMAIVLAYASCTNKLGAKLWVDKTPANERYLDRIRKEMPAAKILQVIREPMATLASRKKMESGASLRGALRDLQMSYGVAADHLNSKDPQYLLVRYEELCSRPKMTTERMAAFLHIPPSGKLSIPTVAGIPSQPNSSFTNEAPAGQILRENDHKQAGVLNRGERELIAASIGNLSRRLDYPLRPISLLRKYYLKLRYRFW